jgi:HNH endonuclease
MAHRNPCSIDACESAATGCGLCFAHRRDVIRRLRAAGMKSKEIGPLVGIKASVVRQASRDRRHCSVDGCIRTTINGEMCSMHTARLSQDGDVGTPGAKVNVGSGENITAHGYRRVYVPGHPTAAAYGWAYEHRMVAYDAWGDVVLGMQVHHKNHDRLDNRLENLELMTQADHMAAHGMKNRKVERGQVVEMYRSGMSTPAIAKAVGSHAGNVYRMLVAEGEPLRSKGTR